MGRIVKREQGKTWGAMHAVAVRVGAALLAVGLVSMGASGAAAQPLQLASLPSSVAQGVEATGRAKPVLAWVKFCEREPAECAVDPAEPEFVTLNARTWRTILTVNSQVNAKVKPLTDLEHWGVVDRWDLAEDGKGDCEDFQLLKRKLLVEKGLPRRALRMTVVIDEDGEGHAVLMVRTDRGDFVLDNKRGSVLAWDQTGYVFVKREGDVSLAWVSLGDLRSPATTANR